MEVVQWGVEACGGGVVVCESEKHKLNEGGVRGDREERETEIERKRGRAREGEREGERGKHIVREKGESFLRGKVILLPSVHNAVVPSPKATITMQQRVHYKLTVHIHEPRYYG